MAVTPLPGWKVDPNNSNGVVRDTPVDNTIVPNTPAPPITPPAAPTTTPTISTPAAPTTPPTPTPSTQTTTPPTSEDKQKDALTQAQEQRTANAEEYARIGKQASDAILSIQSGATPLSAGETAQLNGLQSQFENLIRQQTEANNNLKMGRTILDARNGVLQYSPGTHLSNISKVVTDGLSKVSTLQIQEASAIAQLTQSLKDNDIKAVRDAWSMYKDTSKERQDALQKTIDDTQGAIKQQEEAQAKVQENIDQVSADVLKNTGDSRLAAKVGQAGSVSEALAMAGSSLQSSSDPNVQSWIFAKRQAESNGTVAPDYETFKDKLDQKALDSEIAKLKATEGIKFNYAVALEKAKAQLANAPTPNYNGEFAATIELAAQAGGTNAQRNQIKGDMEGFISQGDYQSAYTQIISSASGKLTGANASNFQQQVQSYDTLKDMREVLKEYEAAGGNTNIFTGGADTIQTKIGVLMTDPKYASIATRLNTAFYQYRQNMTGAAFSGPESAQYASVLPSAGNTFALNMAKIDGAESYLNSVVESTLTNTVGKGGVYIKQYAEAGHDTQKTQQSMQTKMTDFRAASKENEALVQELHQAFPQMTLDQIAEQLQL